MSELVNSLDQSSKSESPSSLLPIEVVEIKEYHSILNQMRPFDSDEQRERFDVLEKKWRHHEDREKVLLRYINKLSQGALTPSSESPLKISTPRKKDGTKYETLKDLWPVLHHKLQTYLKYYPGDKELKFYMDTLEVFANRESPSGVPDEMVEERKQKLEYSAAELLGLATKLRNIASHGHWHYEAFELGAEVLKREALSHPKQESPHKYPDRELVLKEIEQRAKEIHPCEGEPDCSSVQSCWNCIEAADIMYGAHFVINKLTQGPLPKEESPQSGFDKIGLEEIPTQQERLAREYWMTSLGMAHPKYCGNQSYEWFFTGWKSAQQNQSGQLSADSATNINRETFNYMVRTNNELADKVKKLERENAELKSALDDQGKLVRSLGDLIDKLKAQQKDKP